MKRTFSCLRNCIAERTRSKTARLENTIPWVSATKTYNYLIRDPLIDWLEYHSRSAFQRRSPKHIDFLKAQGIEFEKQLINFMRNNILDIVKISDSITEDGINLAISHMKRGTPVLYSVPFENNNNRTRGIIDLVVRSDYIHLLVKDCTFPLSLKNLKAPNLDGNYHYLAIDIKFSTLPLRADGVHLLNSDKYPAYKGQLYIYTQGLGYIQGYTSPYAYILGRRWNYRNWLRWKFCFSCCKSFNRNRFKG